jgi:hypothetical protein
MKAGNGVDGTQIRAVEMFKEVQKVRAWGERGRGLLQRFTSSKAPAMETLLFGTDGV